MNTTSPTREATAMPTRDMSLPYVIRLLISHPTTDGKTVSEFEFGTPSRDHGLGVVYAFVTDGDVLEMWPNSRNAGIIRHSDGQHTLFNVAVNLAKGRKANLTTTVPECGRNVAPGYSPCNLTLGHDGSCAWPSYKG